MSTVPSSEHPHKKHRTGAHLMLAAGIVFNTVGIATILWIMPAPDPKPKPLPKPYEVILEELQQKIEPNLQQILDNQKQLKTILDNLKTIQADVTTIKPVVQSLKKQGSGPVGTKPQ